MPSSGTFSIGTAGGRDYSTLSAWEADTDVALTGQVTGECYADSDFDEQLAIAGASNLTSTEFRLLKPADGEEHSGIAGTGVVVDWSVGSGNQGSKNLLNVNEAFARVEHLEVTHTNTFSDDTSASQLKMVKVGHADAEVHRLLVYEVRCADFSQPVGILCDPGLASNCIVWDATSNTGYNNDFGAIVTRNGGQAYNCTVHEWKNSGSDEAKGFYFRSSSDVVKNCYAGGTEKDFEVDTGASPTLENNASSDGTADDNGGTGHLVNKSPSNQFVDVSGTPPNRDYHLQASADLVDAGQDLGDVRAKLDIDGGDRHADGGSWDIGADEEGLVGVETFEGSVTEGIGLGDAVSAQAEFQPQLTEDVGLGDSVSALLEFQAEIAETIGLAETYEFGKVIEESLQEALGLDDSYSLELIWTLREEIGLADQLDVVLEAFAEAVETVGIGDTVTAQLVASLALAEGFGLDDAYAAARELNPSVTETMGLDDLLSLIQEFGLPSEGAGFGDSYSAVVVALGNLSKFTLETEVRDESCWNTPVNDDEKLVAAAADGLTFYAPVPGEDT